MSLYESDHTKFMRELFEKNPKLAEEQKKARSTWWDKKLNPEERKGFKEVGRTAERVRLFRRIKQNGSVRSVRPVISFGKVIGKVIGLQRHPPRPYRYLRTLSPSRISDDAGAGHAAAWQHESPRSPLTDAQAR